MASFLTFCVYLLSLYLNGIFFFFASKGLKILMFNYQAYRIHEFKKKLVSLDCSAVLMVYCYMYGRQPKVVLTNVLSTKIGRKYIDSHVIIDANLPAADKLQSGQLPSSAVASLQTCQILSSPHESSFLSERYVTQSWFCQSSWNDVTSQWKRISLKQLLFYSFLESGDQFPECKLTCFSSETF